MAGLDKGDDKAALATMEPGQRLDLLTDLYKQVVGSKPKLPEATETETVDEDASRKQRREQKHQAEADWISAQLLAKYQPTSAELEALGRSRANAIQEALLAPGDIDPTRVFITTNKAPVMHEDKVRLELGLE